VIQEMPGYTSLVVVKQDIMVRVVHEEKPEQSLYAKQNKRNP
jgi:hypothetical protein